MGELIVNGLKWAFIIGVSGTFFAVILTLLGNLASIQFGGVIGEVFGIMSMCLPFDLGTIMSGVGVAVAAILAFLVGHKIYNLVTEHVKV